MVFLSQLQVDVDDEESSSIHVSVGYHSRFPLVCLVWIDNRYPHSAGCTSQLTKEQGPCLKIEACDNSVTCRCRKLRGRRDVNSQIQFIFCQDQSTSDRHLYPNPRDYVRRRLLQSAAHTLFQVAVRNLVRQDCLNRH